MAGTLEQLESIINARKGGDPASSYVAKLFARGTGKIAQKLGEEAVETVIAAMGGSAAEVTSEAADLLFHLLVLLAKLDIPFEDVLAELDRREGVSGLIEKSSRPKE